MPNTPQKVSTCLWFDTQAEEAANLYTSLFENSSLKVASRYGKNDRMPEGLAMVVLFTLAGTEFMALNGGPMFKHSEASSTTVQCDSQAEIDRLWAALTADGGKESQCGWLKDRFGLSWQIVSNRMGEFMSSGDPARSARVMAAMMQMVKIDVAKLEAAYHGEN